MKPISLLTLIFAANIILLSSCANLYIRSEFDIDTPDDLSVVKRTYFCSYNTGSFQALLNKGQLTEIDITSAFSHSPSSDWWIANNYILPWGIHTLYTKANFSCLNSKRMASDQKSLDIQAGGLNGTTGPAGGIIFYTSGDGLHGLEAAPEDQGSAPWGCEGIAITGADDTGIGKGGQNTADILAACSETGTAAAIADAYTLNGYNDWYLPSIGEFQLLYYATGSVGGFTGWPKEYWSSTEINSTNAWYHDLELIRPEGPLIGDKNTVLKVRAIRAF